MKYLKKFNEGLEGKINHKENTISRTPDNTINSELTKR